MKQTYIAKVYNSKGNTICFERFSCKNVTTVKKQMLWLMNQPLYQVGDTKLATEIKVYATPDGVYPEKEPRLTMKLERYQEGKYEIGFRVAK